MTGIFYLHPKSPTGKAKAPTCWCHQIAAWACKEGFAAKPEYLCGAHMPGWAQERGIAPPRPPEGGQAA